jgi:hypothetical protein
VSSHVPHYVSTLDSKTSENLYILIDAHRRSIAHASNTLKQDINDIQSIQQLQQQQQRQTTTNQFQQQQGASSLYDSMSSGTNARATLMLQ